MKNRFGKKMSWLTVFLIYISLNVLPNPRISCLDQYCIEVEYVVLYNVLLVYAKSYVSTIMF